MLFVLYCLNLQVYVPHRILITILLFRKNHRGALQTVRRTHIARYLEVAALADAYSDLCEIPGRTGRQWLDSPAWPMLMAKHALPVLSPCEPCKQRI